MRCLRMKPEASAPSTGKARLAALTRRRRETYDRRVRCSIAAAAVAAGVLASTAVGALAGARGTVCGGSGCVTLARPLAVALSQRNDTFSDVSQPKPSPYYRITIKASGEGFTNRTIIWVPSAKDEWFVEDYVTPPAPGYWRTPNRAVLSRLRSAVAKLRPFAAPTRWSRILPK